MWCAAWPSAEALLPPCMPADLNCNLSLEWRTPLCTVELLAMQASGRCLACARAMTERAPATALTGAQAQLMGMAASGRAWSPSQKACSRYAKQAWHICAPSVRSKMPAPCLTVHQGTEALMSMLGSHNKADRGP